MKKQLLMMLAVAVLLTGCNNADKKDTEANTQQTEAESSVIDQDEETSSATSETTETTPEIETEAQTEVETEAQTESEAPSEEQPAPTYTYTDLDKTMYAKSSVNVRDLPSIDGNKLGGLSKAQEVHVTGQCNETGWYRIEYSGSVGYVSNNYLQDSKPAEEVVTQPTQPSEPSSSWYDGYEMYVWYDMGEYFFMRVSSQEEVMPYTRQFPAEYWQVLRERYPDREIIQNGTGPNCAVFSALYTDPESGFPIWSIDYVWD